MLDLLLSTWVYALVATSLLFTVVVGVQAALRWLRGRRRTAVTISLPAVPVPLPLPVEPLTAPVEERVSA